MLHNWLGCRLKQGLWGSNNVSRKYSLSHKAMHKRTMGRAIPGRQICTISSARDWSWGASPGQGHIHILAPGRLVSSYVSSGLHLLNSRHSSKEATWPELGPHSLGLEVLLWPTGHTLPPPPSSSQHAHWPVYPHPKMSSCPPSLLLETPLNQLS